MAHGLAEHGGHDALRRSLQQLAGEAAADAVAHVEEFADPEMVHQPKLVVGECVPRVLDRHRTGGIAAIGIALIHGDAAEVVLELFHRIENGGLPVADARIQSAARDNQQREAGADLLIANANVTLLIERHGNHSQTAGSQFTRARASTVMESDSLSKATRARAVVSGLP
jgi:hypothetical protein